MSDQRQWWKLWHTALSDQVLENLGLETWARWARLNTWINAHGEQGEVCISEPAKALLSVLKVPSWGDVLGTVTTLPGLIVKSDGKNPVTLYIKVKHWRHFQEDRSAERMRRLRAQRDGMEPVTPMLEEGAQRDGGKRRGEEKRKNPLISPFDPGSNGFEQFWNRYPKKVGKVQALREWNKVNPDETVLVQILEALTVQKRTVKAMVEGDRVHILDPERWIKYRRWEDEVSVAGEADRVYPTADEVEADVERARVRVPQEWERAKQQAKEFAEEQERDRESRGKSKEAKDKVFLEAYGTTDPDGGNPFQTQGG